MLAERIGKQKKKLPIPAHPMLPWLSNSLSPPDEAVSGFQRSRAFPPSSCFPFLQMPRALGFCLSGVFGIFSAMGFLGVFL
jgi:hypothetical protein